MLQNLAQTVTALLPFCVQWLCDWERYKQNFNPSRAEAWTLFKYYMIKHVFGGIGIPIPRIRWCYYYFHGSLCEVGTPLSSSILNLKNLRYNMKYGYIFMSLQIIHTSRVKLDFRGIFYIAKPPDLIQFHEFFIPCEIIRCDGMAVVRSPSHYDGDSLRYCLLSLEIATLCLGHCGCLSFATKIMALIWLFHQGFWCNYCIEQGGLFQYPICLIIRSQSQTR